MEVERLEQELRDYLTAEAREVEPPIEWWNTIISGLEDRINTSFWKKFMPKTRLAWALSMLVLLVVSGTAYAGTFIVKELFLNYTGEIEEAGLARELDVSQTVGDITVRLERAYADGNVVLAGFTIAGHGDKYFTHKNELETDNGQILPMMFSMGVVPGSEMVMGDWRPSERIAFMAAFDASPITGEPSSLNLILHLQISESPLPEEIQSSINSFSFDFSVPFTIAKTVNVEQTVEESGIAITLDKIDITPWATKAVFRFPQDEEKSGAPIIRLTLPEGNSEMESFGRKMDEPSSEYRSYFNGDFTDQHGEWTITIKELVLPPDLSEMTETDIGGQKVLIGESSGENRLSGPWIFTFDVP